MSGRKGLTNLRAKELGVSAAKILKDECVVALTRQKADNTRRFTEIAYKISKLKEGEGKEFFRELEYIEKIFVFSLFVYQSNCVNCAFKPVSFDKLCTDKELTIVLTETQELIADVMKKSSKVERTPSSSSTTSTRFQLSDTKMVDCVERDWEAKKIAYTISMLIAVLQHELLPHSKDGALEALEKIRLITIKELQEKLFVGFAVQFSLMENILNIMDGADAKVPDTEATIGANNALKNLTKKDMRARVVSVASSTLKKKAGATALYLGAQLWGAMSGPAFWGGVAFLYGQYQQTEQEQELGDQAMCMPR